MPHKDEPHNKDWVNGIIAKLELVDTECGHCPSGARLETQDLNRILELMYSSMSKFKMVCALYGFITERDKEE